ncbi:hypothetical protein MKW94_004700 [Papaver nudicaule]|uniref:Histidine--tRNA ligase, cytoplasmic n=1 Tax=Papaver nudicaule TaxID=74823 RepID=A0AA41S5A9_PAPNU|nr:hypothetical protein [Papaver nudicaule]
MENAGSNKVIIKIGGKGSTLSSWSVYAIANGLSKVDIDSSVSSNLKSSENLCYSLSGEKPVPNVLTLIETRACLVLLLNKLIITQTGIRFLVPDLICQTLNQETFDFKTLDFSSALGFLDSLFKLNGATLEEEGYTLGEKNVLMKSGYVLDGISALLDSCSPSLSTVADAVALLSCEALKADASVLAVRSLDSGNGFTIKDVASVARDFKVLLKGSNLVGETKGCELISDITEVHGSFRESAKQIHSITLVELNTSVKISKDGYSSSVGSEKPLVKTFLSFAMSVFDLGKSSFCRAGLLANDAGSEVGGMFQSGCPDIEELTDEIMLITTLAARDGNCVKFFHVINNLVATVRNILAWEAVLAIHSLERMESLERSQELSVASLSVETNQVKESPGEKSREKNNKVVLGKGTVVIKQLLKDRLKTGGDPALLNEWVHDLSLFFEPKDAELHTFLKKVREMVETNESRRVPKIPKGTGDYSKEQMAIRERAFKIIEEVFKRHGAMALDTPAFELRETLMGKYGEDSKLVFDLADQGGEICSLRYDLTVPFARYVAMKKLSSFKRYQIGKVYRRDNPAPGRFREFYQCDFDIAGQYCAMGPDFEVVKVLTELLDELNMGDYEIKLNHRKLLDGMLEICGVPPEKFRTICSSIDKLDKLQIEEIKKEMVEEKGLNAEVADKIGALVKKRGSPLELMSELKQDNQFLENKESSLALKDLEILFELLEESKCIDRVVFDLSLARGLDYYTGVIFEAVFKGTKGGSIAGGGRYDNLIGMFGTEQVPAVGVSLGIERVFHIMENDPNQSIRATETEVLVSIFGDDLRQAVKLVSELWGAKIKAEYLVHKRVQKHMNRAKECRIPLMVIVGDQERSANQVRIKDMQAHEEELVDRGSVVEEVQRRLNLISL